MNTPTIPTLPPFIPRKPIKYKPRVPAPAPLLQTLRLVSAVYDDTVPMVFLTFDRPVNALAMVVGAVTVNDGTFNNGVYGGIGGPGIESPTVISVVLERIGDTPAGPATLSASALSGIVAVDDGGTWAGVSGLGLPYDG
jgi:hypothetical protein